MKTLLTVLFIVLGTMLSAQKSGNHNADHYQSKAFKQKKTSRTLTGISIGLGVTSGILYFAGTQYEKNHPNEWFAGLGYYASSLIALAGGVGTAIPAIILSAKAKQNRKKAASLQPELTMQTVLLPAKIVLQPGVAVKINF
ncbi:MAG: hypothetical protein BGN92_11280 [Sphingobacteriales bacterium 41-5]|nr:MAG: hypothetical protein BGN92_11280 [Sphingobacteriales bacterium 41-5]